MYAKVKMLFFFRYFSYFSMKTSCGYSLEVLSTHNICFLWRNKKNIYLILTLDDDDEFRLNDVTTHEGHLCQNGVLTWFSLLSRPMIRHLFCNTHISLEKRVSR